MLGGDDRDRRGGGRGGGGRGEYRRRDQGEKETGAPGEFNPGFRGGFGMLHYCSYYSKIDLAYRIWQDVAAGLLQRRNPRLLAEALCNSYGIKLE